jgi:dodecin
MTADSAQQIRRQAMADSVYRVTELVGTSSTSWEAAAKSAIETAAKSLRDLRVAEVVRQDVSIEDGKVASYRVRLNVSFKYEGATPKAKARR